MKTMLATAIIMVVSCSPSLAAECFDLTKAEPHELTGVLSYRIFPGPPGYQDVQKGDTPEPGYILTLAENICLTGDDFADPETMFNEVQLVPTEQTTTLMNAMQDKAVTVTLEGPMAAETGHHHRPLVAWVTSIVADKDPTADYGTAATTVRAFYAALAAGNGATAANFVIAEKRKKGPLSAKKLTQSYGHLTQPLKLLDVTPNGQNRYLVHYQFTSRKGVCDGKADVTTVSRAGSNFIKAIKALNGC
jgi:hypothetical protein